MSWEKTKRIVHSRERACVWCGDVFGPFHVDHIWPVSLGGTDDLDNLVLACRRCNLEKSNKILLWDWFPKRVSGWAYDCIYEPAEDRLPGEMGQ